MQKSMIKINNVTTLIAHTLARIIEPLRGKCRGGGWFCLKNEILSSLSLLALGR
jgi:hypothetical protein